VLTKPRVTNTLLRISIVWLIIQERIALNMAPDESRQDKEKRLIGTVEVPASLDKVRELFHTWKESKCRVIAQLIGVSKDSFRVQIDGSVVVADSNSVVIGDSRGSIQLSLEGCSCEFVKQTGDPALIAECETVLLIRFPTGETCTFLVFALGN